MTPEPGTVVTVHLNLHKHRKGLPHWSITVKGKVVATVASISLVNATPVVSASTYDRLMNHPTQKRHVYAKVRGTISTAVATDGVEVHLNPYRCRDFTTPDGRVWTGSKAATFNSDGYFTI